MSTKGYRLLFLFMALAALWKTCHAADEWTPGQKAGEAVYLTLHTVDWMQTRYIAKHSADWHESFNTVLGPYPSCGKVNRWFVATTVMQPLIAHVLPTKWREAWIGAGIALEFTLTVHNASVGIGMALP